MITDSPRTLLRPPAVVAVLAVAKLSLLLWCASAYGYFRDELYTLACARRLAWGYVDHPPLSIALLASVDKLYGQSILTMRVVPAVTGVLVVIFAARLARRFGAGALGQGLAALCTVVAPQLLAVDHVYSMASLDVLAWTVAAGLVARAITEDPRTSTRAWIAVGLVLGLGALNKLSFLVYAFGLVVGLCVTPQRAWLRRAGPWLALGIAAVLMSPFLAWQQAHGWPTREIVVHAVQDSLAHVALFAFIKAQLLWMLPTSVVVWAAGLLALLRHESLAPFRLLGVAFLVAFVVLGATRHSADLAPAYPLLFAAGAAALDPWLLARRWRYPVLAGLLATTGAIAAPFAVPVLPVARFEAYAAALHVGYGSHEHGDVGALPERYADMFGWPEMVRAVANVVVELAPDDRDEAVVLASNYGRAAAVDLFGETVGVPFVISGHDSYWLWGTAGASGRVVVAVGGDEALLRAHFGSVEVASVFGHSLAIASERHVRIYVCRDPVAPLAIMWPDFRRYD